MMHTCEAITCEYCQLTREQAADQPRTRAARQRGQWPLDRAAGLRPVGTPSMGVDTFMRVMCNPVRRFGEYMP